MDQNQDESIVDQPSIDYTQLNREIRVFLSSTFKDMQTERDYLLKHVFPEIRALCAERDVGFTEVDLRWGVTEEESKHGKTVELCLTNIDRCRDFPPFFIGFMGERYGWIPEDHQLTEYWKDQPKDEQGNFLSPYAQKIKAALAKGISVTELEMQFGVFKQSAEVKANALFYLRDANYTKSLYEQAKLNDADLVESVFYSDTRPKDDALLVKLKEKIRQSGHLILDNYTDVEAFGEDIKSRLIAAINQRFPAEETSSYQEKVLRQHQRYAHSRRISYVPLPTMRDSVKSVLQNQTGSIYSTPILISGESGLGKSAFMADLEAELRKDANNYLFPCYFTGADGASSLGSWRDLMFYQLKKARGEDTTAQDDSFASLAQSKETDDEKWQRLGNELGALAYRQGKTLLVLLDAINQMNDADEAIRTLQNKLALPINCRLLVTTTPELLAHISTTRWQVVEMIKPDEAQVKEMIKAYTEQFYKKLNEVQIDEILSYSTAYIPLYLKVVLEELRLRSSHESLTTDIQGLMSHDSVQVLFTSQLMQTWDKDYGDGEHPHLASQALSLIAASRAGLSEYELSFLLASDTDTFDADTQQPRLATVTLTRLLAVLNPYMLRRNDRIDIMHSVIKNESLSDQKMRSIRAIIANFFLIDRFKSDTGILECFYQFRRLEDKTNIYKLLSHPKYLYFLTKSKKLFHDVIYIISEVELIGRVDNKNLYENYFYFLNIFLDDLVKNNMSEFACYILDNIDLNNHRLHVVDRYGSNFYSNLILSHAQIYHALSDKEPCHIDGEVDLKGYYLYKARDIFKIYINELLYKEKNKINMLNSVRMLSGYTHVAEEFFNYLGLDFELIDIIMKYKEKTPEIFKLRISLLEGVLDVPLYYKYGKYSVDLHKYLYICYFNLLKKEPADSRLHTKIMNCLEMFDSPSAIIDITRKSILFLKVNIHKKSILDIYLQHLGLIGSAYVELHDYAKALRLLKARYLKARKLFYNNEFTKELYLKTINDYGYVCQILENKELFFLQKEYENICQ